MTRTSHLEREVKLCAGSDFVLPDLTGVVEGAVAAPAGTELLRATYYDTEDLRLIRSGITLRYRIEGDAGGCWTLKLPAAGATTKGSQRSAMRRTEFEVAGGSSPVPPELTDLVRVHLRGALLQPLVGLDTLRHRLELRGGDGEVLAEVDDDDVTVVQGPAGPSQFREIEIEAATGGQSPDARASSNILRKATKRLVAAGAERCDPVPKAVKGFGPGALDPPEVTVDAELPKRATLGQLVRRAIAGGVARLMAHDPGVRVGEDPEDVHQARVAMRRLRSDLKTFRAAMDEGWVKTARGELQWLGRALGEVRDRDVLLERLRGDAESLPSHDQAPVRHLLDRLEAERDEAWRSALEALRSERYDALVEDLVGAARNPPVGELASRRARDLAPGMVRGSWRRLSSRVASLPQPSADDDLHQVRILAKRCRYAAEAVEPVVGRPASRFASALADVQTVLGDQHDAVVAEQWHRDSVRRSPAQAVAAGELILVQRDRAAAGRRAWPKAWRAAKKKRLRTWMEVHG